MMRDPAVRADEKCAVCGRKRVVPKTTYATREQYEVDPFCSAKCARKHYGVKLQTLQGYDEDDPILPVNSRRAKVTA